MPVAIVTGSGGLVGSEAVRYLVESGFDVVGVENDSRAAFFGPEVSTAPVTAGLQESYRREFRSLDLDIRDEAAMDRLFAEHAGRVEIVVHAAAQPSHDWAARDPHADFHINAVGTLNLLEATRRHAPDATFAHCSTSKVYGDTPNRLPLVDYDSRLDLPREHRYWHGIDVTMSIDQSLHSLFGVSKASGDLLVQEYGRYFGLPTGCFRPGCLTGSAHVGTRDHGFLSFLMRCVVRDDPYTIYGYEGKQVRCNLHGADLVSAFAAFHRSPRAGAVYNIGGGRETSCSVLEAIALCQEISGRELRWEMSSQARIGDHRWWISDIRPFQADYPDWRPQHDLRATLQEIHDANAERWLAMA
jgi:CDP-paratose 2-epimerase